MTGAEFRNIRIEIGLTQFALGRLLGFGRPHIQQMESDRRAISRPVELVMLAMADEWRPADFPDYE